MPEDIPITTEVTDPAVETEETDVAQNVRKLEEVNKSQKTELEELRPLRDKEKLRDAGFDPDTDRGKALAIAIKAGEVEADTTKIVEYAEETFGWKPTPSLTPTETQQVKTTADAKVITTETTSDDPPTLVDQIAEAEKAGNHVEALRLTTRQAAERMLSG